jgi:hypothetical protein
MSSTGHAILAVELLRASGHEDASHTEWGTAIRDHIISVPTEHTGEGVDLLDLLRAIDPDAHALA